LKAEHEARVVELWNNQYNSNKLPIPVFITLFPRAIKFFNMMSLRQILNKILAMGSNEKVFSADLITPGAGECTGSAIREFEFSRLYNNLLQSPMYPNLLKLGVTLKDFDWYFDIIKSGLIEPHAGYGMGMERVMQWLLGLTDIRHCSPFALMGMITGDFDESRS